MKQIMLSLILGAHSVYASDYQPLQSEIDHFKGHRLFQSMQSAKNSSTVKQALTRWNVVVEEARTNDDPDEIEDITHYSIYRLGLKEMVRLNYMNGNITEGDVFMNRLESLTLVQNPTGKYLESLCKRSGK